MTASSKPIQIVVTEDGELTIAGMLAEESANDVRQRKARSARCGHIKRRLVRGERLYGKLLAYALDIIRHDEIGTKLHAGETLTDYEMHLVLDVYLLHERLRSERNGL